MFLQRSFERRPELVRRCHSQAERAERFCEVHEVRIHQIDSFAPSPYLTSCRAAMPVKQTPGFPVDRA